MSGFYSRAMSSAEFATILAEVYSDNPNSHRAVVMMLRERWCGVQLDSFVQKMTSGGTLKRPLKRMAWARLCDDILTTTLRAGGTSHLVRTLMVCIGSRRVRIGDLRLP